MKIQVISYQLIKDIIKEYKKLLLVLMGAIFVIFLLLAFLLPKEYESSVMIQVKPKTGAFGALANNTALFANAPKARCV